MKKILFIEDEAALPKTFSEMLKKEDYEVISALDGETGLRLVRERKPDLVLLDLVLPRLRGLDILKALREDPDTKDLPVIILTNLEAPEEVEKALNLGATTYLIKTQYTLSELTEKIKKSMEEKN